MILSNHARAFAMATASVLASLLLAAAAQPLKIDFSNESVGAEPKSFVSVAGVWRIETDGGNKVLVVDGRQWNYKFVTHKADVVEAVSAIKSGPPLVSPNRARPRPQTQSPEPPHEVGAIIYRSIMALSSVSDIRSITNSFCAPSLTS